MAAGSCSLDSSVDRVTVTQFNCAALCATAVVLSQPPPKETRELPHPGGSAEEWLPNTIQIPRAAEIRGAKPINSVNS